MLDKTQQQPKALLKALMDIEQYISRAGWDQPARLFALVSTEDLLKAEPVIAEQLKDTSPDSISSIEQEEFNPAGLDLMSALAQITWPAEVSGCALATERSFLPADLESEIPKDFEKAAEFVANHPARQDLRVVAGVLRNNGEPICHCIARIASKPEELLVSEKLVPALTEALTLTLNQ